MKHPVRKLIVLGAVVLLAAGNSGRSSGDLGRNPAGTVTPNLSTGQPVRDAGTCSLINSASCGLSSPKAPSSARRAPSA